MCAEDRKTKKCFDVEEGHLVRIVSLTDTEAVFSSEGTEITFSAN